MSPKRLAPIHPGEVLLHDFLEPLEMTQYRLAKHLKVPARRIFGTSDRFWLNLQAAYDLDLERDRRGEQIKRDVPVFRKAG